MAGESSGPARRSWKGGDRSTRSRRPSNALWRRRSREDGGPATSLSRNARIIRAAVACLLGIGLIVWLILMIQPVRPASVLLVGADYATNLEVPHNAQGYEGLKGIRELTIGPRAHPLWGTPRLRRARAPVLPLEDATQWGDVLDDLRREGFPGDTLLIFLALHSVNGPAGTTYLLPNRADRPSQGIELATIINDLATLPARKTKVLILEGALVPADWRLGMVHNGFSRRFRELDEQGAIAKEPGLWVLSASDVDQRCWASDGLRRTVFAHYVIEGLRGGAAGVDRRVSLAGLYEYVRRNVRNWVWTARGAVQEPVLLPAKPTGRDARQVVLALATGEPAPRPRGLPEPVLPKALEQRWREFERLGNLAPSPSSYAPRRWATYRATLLRYEQLARAGAEAEAQQRLAGELDRLRTRLEEERREWLRALPQSGGNTLALNALRGGSVDAPPSDRLERLWAAPDPDLEAAIAEYRRAGTAGDEARLPSPQARAEGFLYRRAEDDPEANLAKAAARLLKLRRPDAPLSAEAHFLIMLDQGRGFPSSERPA